MLVICIKETPGKRFHKARAVWNIKASEKITQSVSPMQCRKAKEGNCKIKVTCIVKKQ